MPRATLRTAPLYIEYETFGEASGQALLLVMGLNAQLVVWPLSLCRLLASKGFHVIRFDKYCTAFFLVEVLMLLSRTLTTNFYLLFLFSRSRDCGLSCKMDHLGPPNLLYNATRRALGYPATSVYSLEDMANGDFFSSSKFSPSCLLTVTLKNRCH